MILDELKNWEMLSQVWFVHDYVQLQFHDGHTINVYNPFVVEVNGTSYRQGQFGYADSLVGIIGSTIVGVDYLQRSHFRLIFGCGSIFTIDLAERASDNPEAFELCLSDGPYIEFN